MLEKIRERFRGASDEIDGCRAVVDEEVGALCGADEVGRDGSGQIRYCQDHIPSDAIPYGRVGTVMFYIPETDEFMEKN